MNVKDNVENYSTNKTVHELQLPYTQVVPLAGSISLVSRSYRPEGQGKGRKFEFGDPPNQELNKIIRFKTSAVFKILPDVYSVSVHVR